MAQSPKQRHVLFDHDGGYDDLLSLMMLLAMPHINLVGIVVTPADCFLQPAVSASLKILRFFDRLDVELSEGSLHGVNPFPRAWRKHAYAIDALPILNELPPATRLQQASRGEQMVDPAKLNPLWMQNSEAPPYSQRAAFEDLKQRLYNKLIAALDPSLDFSSVAETRQAVSDRFDRIIGAENIVLSRSERQRLFEAIWVQLVDAIDPRLPAAVAEPGHEFLARKLGQATDPITVLITGPVSNLAAALTAQPDLVSKIEAVVWMGGALNVPGNVLDYGHDGSAEWNAYWDPPATFNLWQTSVPISLFSLDATNKVPVTMEFLHRLARQRRYPLSDLAGQCWAMTVGNIPTYEYVYHMWDTLTTGYLGAPQFISFRQVRSEVVPDGPSAGRTKEVAQGGRVIQVAEEVDVEGFFNYILELFRR